MIRDVRRILRGAALAPFLWTCLLAAAGGPSAGVSVGPLPEWVREWTWTPPADGSWNEKSEGTRYLLYESQKQPQRQEGFTRVVQLMENETGVQDSGSLTFDFNPAFQELILHRVRIHRDGQVMQRLDPSKVKTIQPEPGLSSHLYTGVQTALLFVEDLRVGDVLEYAYTIRGANPVLSGHFSAQIGVQSNVAVDRRRIRVVWNSRKPLQFRQHLLDVAPSTGLWQDGVEHVWDMTKVEAVPFEDNLPGSFEPHAYVEFSDFQDWSQVVEWALPLYAMDDGRMPPELRALIDRWRADPSVEGRARKALQFVQDDLRYTGLELGPDSYRPAPPFESFRLRYGDCKGKVALLCAILRDMGVEAHPALVHSTLRGAVDRRLPSPFAFDHVITRIDLGGKTVWVDPTIPHQGGSLWNRALPPLGKALVVRAGVAALEDVPVPDAARASQRVTSTFELRDDAAPATLTVRTAFEGSDADDMRGNLAETAAEEQSERYLNYYARFYPGVGVAGPLEVEDDRERNIMTVTERYRIDDIWKWDESSRRMQVEFLAEGLQDMLPDPRTRVRRMPLGIDFPMRREQEVIVHLPADEWNIPPLEKSVDHGAFSFRYRRTSSGSMVRFRYECETRAPEVAPANVAGFLRKRAEMEALLGDAVFRPDPSLKGVLARMNWLMVTIAVFGLVATSAGGLWVWRVTRPVDAPPIVTAAPAEPAALTVPGAPGPEGLGGWLTLVGLGLCLGPIIRCVMVARSWEGYFSTDVWQTVAMPGGEQYHALYGPLLVFEVLANILLVGFNVLAIFLFFSRRKIFPRAYIALLMLNAVIMLADEIAGNMIPPVAARSAAPSTRELVRAILYAAIWSAYMLRSRRVKATFVR